MSVRATFFAIVLGLAAFPAGAGEVPGFLADDQRYAAEAKACAPDATYDDGPLLTRSRLSVYTFDCDFVKFLGKPDVDSQADPDQFVAIAVCGDDAGSSRPDLISLTLTGEDIVSVTSQNHYLAQFDTRSGVPEAISLVEREFTRCPVQ